MSEINGNPLELNIDHFITDQKYDECYKETHKEIEIFIQDIEKEISDGRLKHFLTITNSKKSTHLSYISTVIINCEINVESIENSLESDPSVSNNLNAIAESIDKEKNKFKRS